MSSADPFGEYADYYDLIYHDKDYKAEAEFLRALLGGQSTPARTVLELGCGTGRHARLLNSVGFLVHGVERSERMLGRTQETAPDGGDSAATFSRGDARSVRLNRKFDAVISVFHVMSYMLTDADLGLVCETARAHLEPGGLFVFDFWNGPAVLFEHPEVKVRDVATSTVEIVRLAVPTLHALENRVDVHYRLFVKDLQTGRIQEFSELHQMRYLFFPEVHALLQRYGFEVERAGEWMTDRKPDEHCWSAYVVARLRGDAT